MWESACRESAHGGVHTWENLHTGAFTHGRVHAEQSLMRENAQDRETSGIIIRPEHPEWLQEEEEVGEECGGRGGSPLPP